jgi:putative ABC transport system ATP-binding protein
MVIHLENIVPTFLEKEKINNSQIWGHNHTFKKGEKIQIIAPSGSGKTSLIHFLYGLRNDYNGEVRIIIQDLSKLYEKSIKNQAPQKLARIREKIISIVFQDLRLFKDHSVLENIEIKRVLNTFHTESRILQMATQLGIENKLNQQAGTCSYGEQQRIAIIRALQQPFDFIILDEPFSHLDEANSQKAMQLIEAEAMERNAGIILADLQEIPFFKADRTLHL